ncbi:membrane-associated protein, putative [Bodo saltans]|uniref:Membrane-associated protein, putative n=1 Tax=Bodo saltans TaxID=75058 RepID=A0A0S4IKD5_BODSA|nr:membrane-associated protein, putative [Bodo saltans]|eukprot:CUF06680.1 membrane-associated protein, putative [Bodo saltans]
MWSALVLASLLAVATTVAAVSCPDDGTTLTLSANSFNEGTMTALPGTNCSSNLLANVYTDVTPAISGAALAPMGGLSFAVQTPQSRQYIHVRSYPDLRHWSCPLLCHVHRRRSSCQHNDNNHHYDNYYTSANDHHHYCGPRHHRGHVRRRRKHLVRCHQHILSVHPCRTVVGLQRYVRWHNRLAGLQRDCGLPQWTTTCLQCPGNGNHRAGDHRKEMRRHHCLHCQGQLRGDRSDHHHCRATHHHSSTNHHRCTSDDSSMCKLPYSGSTVSVVPRRADWRLFVLFQCDCCHYRPAYSRWQRRADYGLAYFFVAPSAANVVASFGYSISCGSTVTCNGVQQLETYVATAAPTPAPPIATCPGTDVTYTVQPNALISATLVPGSTCNGNFSGVVTAQPTYGAFTFTSTTNLRYIFQAPPIETDAIVTVRVLCNSVPLCGMDIGFIVTTQTPNPTPAPPTNAPPTSAPTTSAPPTPAPTVLQCNNSYAFTVPIGSQLLGNLSVPITQTCVIETYMTAPLSIQGQFAVNILGNFLYVPPAVETVDTVGVDVYCTNTFVCRSSVIFTAYKVVTPAPTAVPTTAPVPTPAPTAAPIASCANVYYYYVRTLGTLSNSLRDMPGQDPCAYGRSFSLLRTVQQGTLVLTSLGDFTYQAPSTQTFFDFTFQETCAGAVLCQGSAYIQVSNSITPSPTTVQTVAPGVATPAPIATPAPAVVLPNAQQTCRGTCNANAWKTVPAKDIWDTTAGTGYVRSDGKKVGGLDISWSQGALVINSYSLIGNLAARYPTFEPLVGVPGTFLNSADLQSQISASSIAFESTCLDKQVNYGMGEDVWKWTSVTNATGYAGADYAAGDSWYQKFGGKHVNCDTFVANTCKYAPLLTPAIPKSGAGNWTIDINNCDATWTGVFPSATLETLVTKAGSQVWTYTDVGMLKGTVYSQAARADSWLLPSKNIDTNNVASNVGVTLRRSVAVSTPAGSPFAIDYDYYEYVNENGDVAFGLNLHFYPYVSLTATSSYAADRHVTGYKWTTANWVSPSDAQCPTCTGVVMSCITPQQYTHTTYDGAFPSGNCPNTTARVFLQKGPTTPTTNVATCGSNPMTVIGAPGIAPTINCSTTYQNITLRGVALGSGKQTSTQRLGFTFEGSLQLQLLLDNGDKPTLAVDISSYVSHLSNTVSTTTVAPATISASMFMCRASVYWPVLDPFGTSTPDRPLTVAGITPAATPGYLCEEFLDSTFGPAGWVTMFFSAPGLTSSQIAIESISMQYNATTVYLYYKDSTTGLAAVPPSTMGAWWQRTHPFLNFRNLADRFANSTVLSSDPLNAPSFVDVPYAFAFTPGTIGTRTTVQVTVKALITASDASVSEHTFTRFLQVDPTMTMESRNGPRTQLAKASSESTTTISAVSFVIVAAVCVTVAGILIFTCNNDAPLPPVVHTSLAALFLFRKPVAPLDPDHDKSDLQKVLEKIVIDVPEEDKVALLNKEE